MLLDWQLKFKKNLMNFYRHFISPFLSLFLNKD